MVLIEIFNSLKKGITSVMHLFHRLFTMLVLLSAFICTDLFAVHTYTSEPAADFTATGLVNNKTGALVGTLFLDPSLPVSKITIAPTMSSASVQMYYVNQNQLHVSTLSGSLYVTYFKTNGTQVGSNLTTQSSLTFNSLDATRPVSFYILVNSSEYTAFLNTVRNIFIIIQSPNRFVSMGCASAFTLLSPSNMTYPVLSNQGESTLPTPFVGGGLTGPAGDRTIFIGEPGVSSNFWVNYNIADEPVYNISFANSDVYIQDIGYATLSPIPLTNLNLQVENYQNTYLGQSRVNVRFYQDGYPTFRFLHTANPACQLPYTLWVNQTEVPYNMPFSPWPAPMAAINVAQISLMVRQQDLDAALEGEYTTTITVEVISGI
jgi:hypothetical protein